MSAEQPREPLRRRVYRELFEQLQARIDGQEMTADTVADATRRLQARARLRIARGLQARDEAPGIADAVAALADDSPAQAARDEALVGRWRQAHGIVEDAGGARARIAERLEQMAARLHAHAALA
jgi:hypothetical protein